MYRYLSSVFVIWSKEMMWNSSAHILFALWQQHIVIYFFFLNKHVNRTYIVGWNAYMHIIKNK